MRRRTFLAGAGSGLAVLAGCTGTASDQSRIEVDLQTVTYSAGAAKPREIRRLEVEPDDIRDEDEIPAALREALSAAVDGEFESESVSEELLAALDELREPRASHRVWNPYVRIDGTEYVFEPELPTLHVELAEETVDEYDPDDVVVREGVVGGHEDLPAEADGHEDLPSAAEYVVQRIGWDGRMNTSRDTYRRSQVPEEIETFLEEYDYIKDFEGVSLIQVERRNWDPPYDIELRELGAEDRYGREIIDEEALSEEARAFVRSVIQSTDSDPPSLFVTDSVPEEYFETLQPTGDVNEGPFVRVDGEVYHVGVTEADHDRLPVDVSAEPAPPESGDRPRFTMTVEATEEGTNTDTDCCDSLPPCRHNLLASDSDTPGLSTPAENNHSSPYEMGTDESIELFGHIGLPSVLRVEHDGEYHLLNSDTYEQDVESEVTSESVETAAMLVHVADREFEVMRAEEETEAETWSLEVDIDQLREKTIFEELQVGEQLSTTYEVPETIPEGTYNSTGVFGAIWSPDEGGHGTEVEQFPFELRLTIGSA